MSTDSYRYRKYPALVLMLICALAVFAACPEPLVTPAPDEEPQPTPRLVPENDESPIGLAAENNEFDRDEISVAAGSNVIIEFQNNDRGVRHNFALYESPDAEESIFIGEVITGPESITYEFEAPDEPGTYFFRCDIHPVTMTGDFIVTEE